MKLEKTMTEFVLEQDKVRIMNFINESTVVAYEKILKYANFIDQELNIGMFVPAVFKNSEWVVLDKPLKVDYLHSQYMFEEALKEYQEAEERVLFKGFEIDVMQCGHKYAVNNQLQIVHDIDLGTYFLEIYPNKKPKEVFIKKIQDLIKYGLELTETAKNQLK